MAYAPGQMIRMYDKNTGQAYMGTEAALASGRWTLTPPTPQTSTPKATDTKKDSGVSNDMVSQLFKSREPSSVNIPTAQPFDFQSALNSIGNYAGLSQAEMQAQAGRAADMVINPQVAQVERNRQRGELDYYNQMKQMEAAQAGVDKTLAYNESQRRKQDSVRSAASGGGARSGLNDYLGQQTDQALEGTRLGLAAEASRGKQALIDSYRLQNQQIADMLGELEARRGLTAGTYYDTMSNAERDREAQWNQNRASTALGIGQLQQQAQQSNINAALAQLEADDARYATDMRMATDLLPYITPTKYQQGMLFNETANTFGQAPGAQSGPVGLRDYAESQGANVGWDPKTGSVSVNGKTYTQQDLKNMGGQLINGRWKIPQSAVARLF